MDAGKLRSCENVDQDREEHRENVDEGQTLDRSHAANRVVHGAEPCVRPVGEFVELWAGETVAGRVVDGLARSAPRYAARHLFCEL